MQGFKSFANRTTIPFPSGYNVIAGPNGSGKSNVIDALTFVLGTTSARSIRAQKLQNLIFNGGRSRKPAEYCEVSLYLENDDNRIPIPEKEIKITRRITRSGISIYKLNGRTITRTRAVEILSRASLSPDGYNIIMQGDVTRIIEMSSSERKEIIDDISGITEFNEKKAKATGELEKVELRVRENMIVVAEKQRLVTRLREEKENAEKYVKLESELKKTKASLVKKKLSEAEEKMAAINKEIEENAKIFDKMEKEFAAVDENLEKIEKTLSKKSEQIIEKSRNIETLRKIDAIQTDIVRKKDKIEFNEREIERLKSISLAAERNLAVKEILNMSNSDVHGTVMSLVKIPRKYATALDVAIGKHKSDIVVSNEDTAAFCIKHLKEKRIGRARFLPLNKMKSRERKLYNNKNVIDYAINLIEYDKRLEPAIKYVLENTLVTDNIDIAKRIQGFRVVTLDGDLVETSGAMTGGFFKKKHGVQSYTGEISKLSEENAKFSLEIEKLEKGLEKLRGEQQEESQEFERLQQSKMQEEQELGAMRKRRKELYEERLVMQNKISRLRIDKARLEATLDNLKIEFQDYRDIKDFFHQSAEELQERVRRVLIEINRLGPVNMKAIEEFGMINVEFEELKKKLDKLLEEKDAVVNVVQEIETKRYDKFMETFNNINLNFTRIYFDLTGGNSKLKLEVENNIDSGLIIAANPSGKKILNLDAMSGGEKAIASLAFLFAIMQHYASPFYVLDEIDAALDKANTKKVSNLIKKYSKNVQFIVISHNDFTIAEADKVFGISMEEGVSRVFGIDLSKG
jgi:chromosome segregation protein